MDNRPILPTTMLELPAPLRDGITQALATIPSTRWIQAAQNLSERYRAERRADGRSLARGEEQALGYAALILPAAYAQLRGAMAATAARCPDWHPTSLLDLGSGPGTALWAALDTWTSLEQLNAWEREMGFITLGRTLARHGAPALRMAHWEQRDLAELSAEGPGYDLVVLGHVLNELDPALRKRIVHTAWQRTTGVLLIVEPGTSAAFPALRAVRDELLNQGAITLAPCPHNLPCPLTSDWCHFPQRLQRPAFQRRARAAPSTWEDSKYSYAALARFPAALSIQGRVLREPVFNKAYAEAQICSPHGIALHQALKRHREAFHQLKHLIWGQALMDDGG